nr:hypothetical protein [Tanacetum cinerariifolium]
MPAGKIGVYTRFFELSERLERPFFWIDAFVCPALILWHTGKSVPRDVILKSSEFSPEHYATLVVYPAPFHKNGFSFLYPYCQSYEGRVVLLLPVAPDHSSGELEASAEKLFGGEGSDIDLVFACWGCAKRRGQGVIPTLPFVSSFVSTTPEREGGDHTKLLAGADLPAIGAPQRFVISSDSSDHSGVNIAEAEVDSVARTSMPIITIATTTTPTADLAANAKEKLVGSFIFGADSPSAGESHPIPGGFSDCSGSDFLIGGIRTVIDPDSNLQKVYVPQWNVTNGFCLDDSGVCREMVDEFAPPKFFASVRGIDHDQLFTEFNVGAACQISLSAEVRMRAEYNIKEMRRLNSVVEEKDSLLKSSCEEIECLKAQLLVKETKATKAVYLRAKASKFEIVKKSLRDETQVLKECNATLEKEKSELEIQVTDLAASVKVREQEVADLDAVVTSVKLQNDSLADQVRKLEASSAGLQEKVTVYENYTSQLEKFQDEKMEKVNEKFDKLSAIGKAIKKGMQEGLSVGITHGAEGRNLTDIVAYNPFTKGDYLSALQRLQSVNFSLIAELKGNKDASVETIMNLLRLKDALAEKLGLVESQPHVDQLMVPIHHSQDQCVIGSSALSLSLEVSSSRVQSKENIVDHVSALCGVFVPLSKPISAIALEGTEGTFGAALDTTTALSVTSISASTSPPISTDDYEVVHTDGQEGTGAGGETVADESVVPFPNVSDAELDVLE